MTAPVPPVNLDQLERLLAAATPGPWTATDERADGGAYIDPPRGVLPARWVGHATTSADAAAIVASVNAASPMVAELRAIRAERDTLRRQLAVARELYRTAAPLDGGS